MHLNIVVIFPDVMLANLDCTQIFSEQLKCMSPISKKSSYFSCSLSGIGKLCYHIRSSLCILVAFSCIKGSNWKGGVRIKVGNSDKSYSDCL